LPLMKTAHYSRQAAASWLCLFQRKRISRRAVYSVVEMFVN